MGKTSTIYLLKVNRILVWFLLVFLAIFVTTGYGITNPNLVSALTGGFMDLSWSLNLHKTLDLPLMALLLIHILIELRFTLARWGIRNEKALNILLVAIGLFLTSLLILMDTWKI